MDPTMMNGGDYAGSAITDSYAVGITLLVCLTNRSAFDIFFSCEEEWCAISHPSAHLLLPLHPSTHPHLLPCNCLTARRISKTLTRSV
jgi:hypothetical protein